MKYNFLFFCYGALLAKQGMVGRHRERPPCLNIQKICDIHQVGASKF